MRPRTGIRRWSWARRSALRLLRRNSLAFARLVRLTRQSSRRHFGGDLSSASALLRLIWADDAPSFSGRFSATFGGLNAFPFGENGDRTPHCGRFISGVVTCSGAGACGRSGRGGVIGAGATGVSTTNSSCFTCSGDICARFLCCTSFTTGCIGACILDDIGPGVAMSRSSIAKSGKSAFTWISFKSLSKTIGVVF